MITYKDLFEAGIAESALGCKCYKNDGSCVSRMEDGAIRYAMLDGEEIAPTVHPSDDGRVYVSIPGGAPAGLIREENRISCHDCPFRNICTIYNDEPLFDVAANDLPKLLLFFRKKTGMTQQQFEKFLGVPSRTYESWEMGERRPPAYVVDLIKSKVEDRHNALMMPVIEEHGRSDMIGFDNLAEDDQFIYHIYRRDSLIYEFMAIKADESHAVFLNARQKFIVAEKYKNCLSIGTSSTEYDSYSEAKKSIR